MNKKRLITVMVEVEDNDHAEQAFYNWANDNIQPKYISTTLNTDHLQEDKVFKKMTKQRKELSIQIQDYIIRNNCS